jgi:hypothetical protein
MAKVLWTQKQDIGPRPRVGHAMAFDAARRRIVLFGGDSLANTLFGDTWEWDGESWTQVQDIGPSTRAFHAMAYDSVRRRSVVFGGRNANGFLGDTWEWDGEHWTQVADSGPSRRMGHAMAFDPNRRRVVLFGGDAAGRLGDTWEWDGNEWVQQEDTGPSPRVHAAMAYDTRRSRLVLFGGAAQDAGLGDTWEWDGVAWTEESDFGPDGCAGAAMVFKRSRVALFGGIQSIASPPPAAIELFDRSWEWDGRHWTARQDMGPGDRVFHAMAFDEARFRVVLFGGSAVPTSGDGAAAGVQGDTWEQFEEGASTNPGPDPGPPPGSVGVAAIEVVPNAALPGGTVDFQVTLTGPALEEQMVVILLNGIEFESLAIAPGEASGALSFLVPQGSAAGVVQVTARLGSSEAQTTFIVALAPGVGEVTELRAEPNPVSPGQTLLLTVVLSAPLPAPVNVELFMDNQTFGNMTIPDGATTGDLAFPIAPGTQPVTFMMTARSGGSEASVEVTIQ